MSTVDKANPIRPDISLCRVYKGSLISGKQLMEILNQPVPILHYKDSSPNQAWRCKRLFILKKSANSCHGWRNPYFVQMHAWLDQEQIMSTWASHDTIQANWGLAWTALNPMKGYPCLILANFNLTKAKLTLTLPCPDPDKWPSWSASWCWGPTQVTEAV